MAMAAYNVGFYHIQDAREITSKLDKDPNLWIDVKTALPLLAKRKWYKQTRYGFARGWEPVRYVENIRSYYDILKWVDDSKSDTVPVPDEFFKIPNSL
jgi:membrane-bound lytic murein transglycosylase F